MRFFQVLVSFLIEGAKISCPWVWFVDICFLFHASVSFLTLKNDGGTYIMVKMEWFDIESDFRACCYVVFPILFVSNFLDVWL